jgi:hypothetical protein
VSIVEEKGLLDRRVAVVLSLAVVMLLIADLDRPREGLVHIDQQPLMDLGESLNFR